MTISEILAIVGVISGVIILIATAGFIYFIVAASRYGSRDEANKFFGSYMLNHPRRYTFAFSFLVIGTVALSIGFISAFVAAFFMDPLHIWEITGAVSLTSLTVFFVTFTSIDNPKQFMAYIKFLKKRHQSSL